MAEGVVTAADIQTPHDVEVINPGHVIANLSQGGKLDMQIKVEKGRGYVPGSMRRHGDEPNKSIGRIVLDASFSPVRRVSYTVESARVEQRTDLDKLVVEIETNGAVTAEDAVRASAKILVEQLVVFAQLEGSEPHVPGSTPPELAVRPHLAASGGRAGADGAFGKLPQGRKHLLHRRSDPTHRERAAARRPIRAASR